MWSEINDKRKLKIMHSYAQLVQVAATATSWTRAYQTVKQVMDTIALEVFKWHRRYASNSNNDLVKTVTKN